MAPARDTIAYGSKISFDGLTRGLTDSAKGKGGCYLPTKAKRCRSGRKSTVIETKIDKPVRVPPQSVARRRRNGLTDYCRL